ncbi:MAG: hypothetical protein KF789_02730 [Bdellovibrionaceae bacterium]|nr:hypothetical protein [Pseudobdellovibrionaceae bacterium]
MNEFIPPQPPRSFRVVLDLSKAAKRLDVVLLAALRDQKENLNLHTISRVAFKKLFTEGRVLIKGQRATVSSGVAKGITYIDILGY